MDRRKNVSPPIDDELQDGGQRLLLSTVREVAKGNLGALDDLYALLGKPGLNPEVAEFAEAIGMILVKLEGREFHLQRAAEVEHRLKHLNQLKDRHLGIAAHDLRNPITSIRGMSQMLLESDLDDGTRRMFLESILRVSDQMLTLVNNLLDVAVIASGKLEMNMEPSNLGVLTIERVQLMSPISKKKGIDITIDVQEVPDTRFDPDRIGQVVDNLLSNAVKFGPRDSEVQVSCRPVGGNVEIAFTDEGPGIPPGDLDKLFGTFQKLTAQPTGGEKSTGLGLSIAKKIVDAHEAEILVNSELGKGSTFTLVFPLQPSR